MHAASATISDCREHSDWLLQGLWPCLRLRAVAAAAGLVTVAENNLKGPHCTVTLQVAWNLNLTSLRARARSRAVLPGNGPALLHTVTVTQL